jgi:hypothetical protein
MKRFLSTLFLRAILDTNTGRAFFIKHIDAPKEMKKVANILIDKGLTSGEQLRNLAVKKGEHPEAFDPLLWSLFDCWFEQAKLEKDRLARLEKTQKRFSRFKEEKERKVKNGK